MDSSTQYADTARPWKGGRRRERRLMDGPVSPEFISPDRNKVNLEGRQPDIMPFRQPEGAASIVEKVAEIPRRSGPREEGFDSIGVVMVYCRNDGSEITVVRDVPAPAPSDDFHYDQMIRRLGHIYDSWFQHI